MSCAATRKASSTRLNSSSAMARLALEQQPPDTESARKKTPPPFLFAESPLDFTPARQPKNALRSFVRAFARRRAYAVCFPSRSKASSRLTRCGHSFDSEPRIANQVDALRQHLDDKVTVDGNTARLVTGPEARSDADV